jgi:hypothetical protein
MARAIVESPLEALNLAKEAGRETKVLLCTPEGTHKITVYPDGEWVNEDTEYPEDTPMFEEYYGG